MESYNCDTRGTIEAVIAAHDDEIDLSPLASGGALVFLFPDAPGLGDNPDEEYPTSVTCYRGGAYGVTIFSSDFPEGSATFGASVSLETSESREFIISHELGHVLGAGHAGRLRYAEGNEEIFNHLGSVYFPHYGGFQGDQDGGTSMYGDRRGIMGFSGGGVSHSGAILKEMWGYLKPEEGAPHRIQEVTTSGLYPIYPLSEEHPPVRFPVPRSIQPSSRRRGPFFTNRGPFFTKRSRDGHGLSMWTTG